MFCSFSIYVAPQLESWLRKKESGGHMHTNARTPLTPLEGAGGFRRKSPTLKTFPVWDFLFCFFWL